MSDDERVPFEDAYPFPDDEIIYHSSTFFENPAKHSYTAVARLPEHHSLVINDAPHNNTHRLVIHTPIRGPVSFLTRPRDMEGLLLCVLRLAAEGEGVLGPRGEIHLHQRWFEEQLGPVEWHPTGDYVCKDAQEAADE